MTLTDPKLDDLLNLIGNSFRVHPNQDPVYVETANHLDRVAAPQHQVIFGRRGSGKSCLLVHFHRHAKDLGVRSLYVNADEVKRLRYPDLLVRLLLAVLRELPQTRRRLLILKKETLARRAAKALEALLDEADVQAVSHRRASTTSRHAGVTADAKALKGAMKEATESVLDRTASFEEQKLDHLERHLQDYKDALKEGLPDGTGHLAVIVDDFYLLPPAVQPDVIDYLHRLVRGTGAFLKMGTIRHRTRLVRYEGGQTVGVEQRQDVEAIDLDRTFEQFDDTRAYLTTMLDAMGAQVGVERASQTYLSGDGLFQLALCSGGVPRDYLNIFTEAVGVARSRNAERVTPTHVYKASARESYRTKLHNFRQDVGGDVAPLERLFQDLMIFCIREKKKTAFLVSQAEAQSDPDGHELIQQLMDFKLIHVVEADTSAASGRPGRYEAYTLDFSAFMEPRRRGIEIVEFWKTDEHRRPRGLREAPVYPLARGRAAATSTTDPDAEEVAESLDAELGIEDEAEISDEDLAR